MEFDYSSIRYFTDEEFIKVLPSLRKEANIRRVANYMQEGITDEEYDALFDSMKTTLDFQMKLILKVLERVEKDSITELTAGGLSKIDLSKPSVFISNHRNIVLDASLMNLLFYRQDPYSFNSSAIAIGNNLLGLPWVKDLARINKSFIVERDTNAMEMLRSSQRLSHYIRHVLQVDNRSVWIAQREGRTKDGNDLTQPGLLKMLNMAGPKDFAESFAELNFVPVAISYEFDPNAAMKMNELHIIETEGSFTKGPMDDFNSMFMGCVGQKGRVHYEFGEPITFEKLSEMNGDKPLNEKIKSLAETIDQFVYQNYKIFPSAYAAADILNGDKQFASKYTDSDKADIEVMLDESMREIGSHLEEHKQIFLKMYATPVKNRFANDEKYHFSF
jgi:1-acyl-sn-glycerol-3-phosphate acyltransferase